MQENFTVTDASPLTPTLSPLAQGEGGRRGPVTALIEQRLLAANRDKGLVVWLDADGAWTHYVDALIPRAKELGITVLAFRGSYLELIVAMRSEATGVDKPPLVLHLPGLTDEAVKKTPALELYRAGSRFEHNLASVVRDAGNGRVPKADLDQLLATPGLTLASADAFLGDAARPRDDSQRSLIATMEVRPSSRTSPPRRVTTCWSTVSAPARTRSSGSPTIGTGKTASMTPCANGCCACSSSTTCAGRRVRAGCCR